MLTVYRPGLEDLLFKQQMLADKETMSYNHAYGGTIAFPKERWAEWYGRWVACEDGRRYYRYLKDDAGMFVGEVSYHYEEPWNGCAVDVLIHAKYRGRGYGGQALDLICAIAEENGIPVLYDEIAADNPAVGMFLKHGFTETGRTEETVLVKKVLSQAEPKA